MSAFGHKAVKQFGVGGACAPSWGGPVHADEAIKSAISQNLPARQADSDLSLKLAGCQLVLELHKPASTVVSCEVCLAINSTEQEWACLHPGSHDGLLGPEYAQRLHCPCGWGLQGGPAVSAGPSSWLQDAAAQPPSAAMLALSNQEQEPPLRWIKGYCGSTEHADVPYFGPCIEKTAIMLHAELCVWQPAVSLTVHTLVNMLRRTGIPSGCTTGRAQLARQWRCASCVVRVGDSSMFVRALRQPIAATKPEAPSAERCQCLDVISYECTAHLHPASSLPSAAALLLHLCEPLLLQRGQPLLRPWVPCIAQQPSVSAGGGVWNARANSCLCASLHKQASPWW